MGNEQSVTAKKNSSKDEEVKDKASKSQSSLNHEEFPFLKTIKVPIVYHKDYNIIPWEGLENAHSFDGEKYGKVMRALTEKKLLSIDQVHKPSFPEKSTLKLVHSESYLEEIETSSQKIARIVEVGLLAMVPIEILKEKILRPMLLATQGTIDGGLIALEKGWAINLSGGYHHASAKKGGGFCIYADITLCIRHLQKSVPSRVKKAMIIDLDAHQGNGHETDFLGDENISIIDVYNHNIYPGDYAAAKAIKRDVELSFRDDDEAFLKKLRENIPVEIESFKPDFILYNAGTDCLVGDPLGGLKVSKDGIIKRDEYVFEQALKYKVPILMVLSGGYQKSNAGVIASSIMNLKSKFKLW